MKVGLGFERSDVSLMLSFFKVNLRDRFLGSSLGMIWAVANPVLLLLTFTFVFGFVFKSRLPGVGDSLDYTAWLIAGYGAWLAIVDSIMSSTVSVVGNSSFVKNLSFKTEVLPIAGGLMGIVPLVVGLAFLFVLLTVRGTTPSLLWLWVLPVVVTQFALCIGIGFVLSSLNVFVRDVAVVLPTILLLMLFGSPIFYPIDAMPGIMRIVSELNPFYIITQGFRQPLVFGSAPALLPLLYVMLLSLGAFLVGLRLFRRAKLQFDGYL